MTYRKTWFSYVLWAAYAGLCVMLLSYTGYQIYAGYVAWQLARLGALVIFPVLVSVYLALRLSSQAIRKRYSFSRHGMTMLEAAVVSVSFVFGILCRIRWILDPVLTNVSDVHGIYYENSLIRAGEEIEPVAHGVSYLYMLCLSAVFSFLGNGVNAAMLLQAFLQLLAMAFGFCAVKKAAGRLPACVVLLCMAFSDAFLRRIAFIDPEGLYLTLYLMGLLAMISFVKSYLTGRSVWGSVFGAVFAGILIGVLLYLDLWSATLLFFLAGLFIGKKEKTDGIFRRIRYSFMTIVSCAVGFFGVIGADAVISNVSVERAVTVWIYPYLQIRWNGFLLGTISEDSLFWALLVVPAAFLVFEFMRDGREQNYTLWLFVCVLFTPVLMMDLNMLGYGSILLFFWSVMAGLGMKNCVLSHQAQVMQAKIQEINASVGAEAVQEIKAATEIAEKSAAIEKSDVSEKIRAKNMAAEQPQEKPRYIENPLPVPKKHIKREMDYDHEIPEADMHFDVEIIEEDDFEIG